MGYALTSFSSVRGGPMERAALAIGVGLLANYCLMLTGQAIARVFVAGTVLALWGLVRLGADLRTGSAKPRRLGDYGAAAFATCGIGYLMVVYYFEILSEPLEHWDARSIWFFHAKMIWTDGALRQQGGWSHPSLAFSHPDYPKLVPAIAAQLAYLKGYWNEFLPKGGLFVMFVPLIFWIFGFRRKRASFVLLLLIFFFSLDAWLSNGYMDGYLALYCGVALLSFGRYLSESRDVDLYSGMCALGIAAALKNEGLLFAVCLLAALLFIRPEARAFSAGPLVARLRSDSVFVTVLILSIAPTLAWTIYKTAWGLQNDIAGDPSAGWSRLSGRLFDGFSPRFLFEFLTVRATAIWMLTGLLAATALFSVRQRVKLHRGALVAAATSGLYFCGLYVAYLSTPLGLNSHLNTSATRTMATASMALLVSLFFLLSDLEAHDGQPRLTRG